MTVDLDRDANAGNGETRVHRGGHVPAAEYLSLERVDIAGDDVEFAFQFLEPHAVERFFEAAFDRATMKESAHRRKSQVEPAPQIAGRANFRSESFQFPAVVAGGPERPDVRPHAGSRDDIDGDPVLLENLDHSDVGEPACAAG